MKRLVLLLVIGILHSCQQKTLPTKPSPTQSMSANYQSVAEEKYGKKCQCSPNEKNTFVLCFTKNTANQDGSVAFFVYDIKQDKITYENNHVRSVKWESPHALKVYPYVGIASNNPDEFYYYDITEGKKRKAIP